MSLTSNPVGSIVSDIVADIVADITGATPLDPDAAAYIEAVEAAGGTVTAAQSPALNTFFSAGWTRDYGIKRLFLPIWGSAGPDAIDLVILGSGVFTGAGWIHGSGGAKSNGTTDRFGFGASPNTMGLDHGVSSLMGCLIMTAQSKTGRIMSAQQGAGNLNLQKPTSNTLIAHNNTSGLNAYVTPLSYENTVGVISNHRWSSTAWEIHRRRGAGVTRTAGNPSAADTYSCAYEMTGCARNETGVYSDYTDPTIGAWFGGLGFSVAADMDAFTLSLATLWEDCTGLTLP